jgi:hypothetical protein
LIRPYQPTLPRSHHPAIPISTVLKDEPDRTVIRVGDTVNRRAYPWTPTIHALLAHLKEAGFNHVPTPLGIDDSGREHLSYIPGASGRDGWPRVADETGLVAFAHLLRDYHDAVRSFNPPPDATWVFTDAPLTPNQIICHNDFGPWNVVWNGTTPVAIIDWDFAAPGDPLDDVAYALEFVIPFRDDDTALRWHAFDRPPDRRRRIELFAAAYGLSTTNGLVDRVIQRQRLAIAHVHHLAARGYEPQKRWLTDGTLNISEAQVLWSEENRHLLT